MVTRLSQSLVDTHAYPEVREFDAATVEVITQVCNPDIRIQSVFGVPKRTDCVNFNSRAIITSPLFITVGRFAYHSCSRRKAQGKQGRYDMIQNMISLV